MIPEPRPTPPPAPGATRDLGQAIPRWPLRVFIVAALVMAVGVYLFPSARTAFLIGFAAATAWAGWSWWDATRGAAFALTSLRASWLAKLAGVDNGGDIHVMEDGQPLIVRLALRGRETAATVLTPLSETTAAFRIWPRGMPKPSFDGAEPPVGGPRLTPLPALESVLGGALVVEGNEPARIMRWLDADLVRALILTVAQHHGLFRGLTFDGRFLGVHWLTPRPDGAGAEPLATLQAASPLWRPFVPRLPSAPPSLMH